MNCDQVIEAISTTVAAKGAWDKSPLDVRRRVFTVQSLPACGLVTRLRELEHVHVIDTDVMYQMPKPSQQAQFLQRELDSLRDDQVLVIVYAPGKFFRVVDPNHAIHITMAEETV